MIKKRLRILLGIGFMLASIMVYWFFFSRPNSFPSDEQLVKEMNSIFPEAEANAIQDTISVDDRHVLVPFVSEKDDYGLSYWVWEKHKWRVSLIETKGTPNVWMVDKNNPSSYYVVWNIHPKDHLSSIHFYYIQDRGYHITEGVERYYPRVQLEKLISLKEKSYGVMKLPDEWVTVMNNFIEVESARQSNMFFDDYLPGQFMYFGWIPYDQDGKELFPEWSVNGDGFSNGDISMEHIRILNEVELETLENIR